MAEQGFSYNRLIFIGRYQPPHRGHIQVIEKALESAERVSLLLGSVRQPRSIRNPWFENERVAMLRAALQPHQLERIDFGEIEDVLYDDEVWRNRVFDAVAQHPDPGTGPVGITGHDKDASSYYLKIFPQWPYLAVPHFEGLNATPIREALFSAGPDKAARVLAGDLAKELPAGVVSYLLEFVSTEDFRQLCDEYDFIQSYRAGWRNAPYPPVFVTVDALVQHREDILLVRRGQAPGSGQLAMPGGFVDPQERLATAVRRELLEETGLDLSVHSVTSAIPRVYDHPDRSLRGRFFTHVFHFQIDESQARPQVTAGDDAGSVHWCSMDELDSRQMFEDHYCIIQHLLNRHRHTIRV